MKVRVSAICVSTREKAVEILEALKVGVEFETLAARYSIHSSKSNGGDLGFISRRRLHPSLEEKVFELKEGEVSNPLKTPEGWWVVKSVEKR